MSANHWFSVVSVHILLTCTGELLLSEHPHAICCSLPFQERELKCLWSLLFLKSVLRTDQRLSSFLPFLIDIMLFSVWLWYRHCSYLHTASMKLNHNSIEDIQGKKLWWYMCLAEGDTEICNNIKCLCENGRALTETHGWEQCKTSSRSESKLEESQSTNWHAVQIYLVPWFIHWDLQPETQA
jgi:hypothetical protein